ncbi:MAG TPA: amidohydrolase, partial [Candidatus Polarisedimenticolia bacterium]|nr:amidohydrolase [Candidatus Polarisedimenticolia bacterium]
APDPHMTARRLIPLLSLLLAAATGAAAGPGCRDAGLVLINGRIATLDAGGRLVEALAARDGKVVAVGGNEEVSACAGDGTQVIDLGGKTVLPGLIDVHTHALDWAKGILQGEIDAGFPEVRSIADLVRRVGERVAATKPGEWITGSGWDDAKLAERRYVTRQDLDPISPANPVYLVHVSGHLAVANGAALRQAGITRDTKEPPGGVIEHDRRGDPTGILKDAAMDLMTARLPPEPPDLAERAATLASEKAVEVGLTTIHDILRTPADRAGYQRAHERGGLKARVQMVPVVGSLAEASQLVQTGLHTGFGDEELKLGAVKMFADGGMGARTIAIYPPGVEGEPDNLGLLIWKPEEMRKAHRMLAAAGWQLTTHAIGDRAIDQVLDSYAAAIKALDLRDPRFRIVHCGISTPAIQKRLRERGVMVDGDPPFVYWIGSWFRKYGAERVRWSYPGRSYLENGIVAGGGSDVSVTPISPWWGIWAGVTRRELISGEVLAPEERLTVPQVLALYTRNGALIGREERIKGSLEPGKLADFIVVDRNVFGVPVDELKDVQVLQTFVGGRRVYAKP